MVNRLQKNRPTSHRNSKAGNALPRAGGFVKLAALAWFLAIVVIMGMILNYSNSPGTVGRTPLQWPADTGIALDANRPTLIMFAHPHCPCTKASLGELELLMAHCQGKLRAEVVFIQPAGTTEDWVKTGSWTAVAAIPGVSVSIDPDGREAQRFEAETSGETVLYNASGQLLFKGGITVARGHSGDNAGRSAIESLLLEKYFAGQAQTPVFGCALFASNCAGGAASCKP